MENDYNTESWVIGRNVSGTYPVAFEYDRDRLVISAGNLNIQRDLNNGFIPSTSIGNSPISGDIIFFIMKGWLYKDQLNPFAELDENKGGICSSCGKLLCIAHLNIIKDEKTIKPICVDCSIVVKEPNPTL